MNIVIGNGWSALGAVGFLALKNEKVTWITGTGGRIRAPMPTLEASNQCRGLELWSELARGLGIEVAQPESGSFLREFRNKAFREPAWTKAPSPEERKQVMDEMLWAPERMLTSLFEARLGDLTLGELEEQIRARLSDGEFAGIKKIEGVPVQGFRVDGGRACAVVLSSGEEIEGARIIYADRWSLLPALQGLPKGLAFTRRRDPVGVLQASFTHEFPVGIGLKEGFFGALHKEAGEEFERHVWGHFSSDGQRSFWTLCLSQEEVEDNHEIAKRLRRMKGALDKMFTGTAWVPEGKTEFMSNVRDEQVRFEEAMIFAGGDAPLEPISVSKIEGLHFLTDGYGPSSALHQVGLLPGLKPGSEAQAERMNPANASLATE
jgi:hypothetical protein